MKTPFGTEVDLGPGHIVLDGVPAPTKGAKQPPLFGPCLLWPQSAISVTAELLLASAAIWRNKSLLAVATPHFSVATAGEPL